MQMETTGLLLLGLLAASANLLGGTLILPSGQLQQNERWLKLLIAVGAGFMLAVIFIEILPRTISLWLALRPGEQPTEIFVFPMLLLLTGYFLINLFEQILIPHFHLDAHTHAIIKPSAAYAAVGGLLFHAFFDGVALAAATSINFSAGLLILLAIFLHKLPEGFTVSSLVVAAGQTTRQAVIASAIVGLATLFGVLLFALLKNQAVFSVAYVLPVAAGVTLHVSASELIPELYHHKKNPLISVFVIVGVALFFALHTLFHTLLER